MTGPAVFAMESGEDIRADAKRLTLVAVCLVTLFLWVAYRSLLMVFAVACPLLVGIIAATATILLLHHQVHGITLAFGITLAGVAVDYPIHLLTGMSGNAGQNQKSMIKIWRTLRLGVFSTVIAYAAFLASGFGGMQQLGLFTIVGLTAAALFSRWVLPLLVVNPNNYKAGLAGLHGKLRTLGQKAPRLRWLVIGNLLVAPAALVITEKPVLHLNVDSLSPIKDARRAESKLLRGDLGFWYGGSMLVVTARDKENVLQFSERIQPELDALVEDQIIQGYDMAADFLPSMNRQRVRKSQIGDASTLQAKLELASAGLPFRENVFAPFIEDIAAVSEMELINPAALEHTAIGRKLNPLMFDFDGEAGGVILLHGVDDEAAVKALANQHDGLFYLHLKTASTALVARSVDRVSFIMLGCIGVIFMVLAVAFSSLGRPLKIMVPALSAAAGTAAFLVFTGHPLSIFHLVSLLLVVGLGLDYALFFNRLPENHDEWDTTFRALWMCEITTVLVFGILAFAQTPPLHAIGMTVGMGALMSIVFAAMWATTPETAKA